MTTTQHLVMKIYTNLQELSISPLTSSTIKTHQLKQTFSIMYRLHHPPFLHLLYVLCIILSTMPFSSSEIKDTSIRDDSRSMILFERFGFLLNGHVSISIKHVNWKSRLQGSALNPSSMGFFLLREQSYPLILNESLYTEGFCVVSSKYVKLIFKFDKLGKDSTYNGSITIGDPDEYNLFFGNCQPEFEVAMDVHTEMYNVKGDTKDFLPAGQTPLPKMYYFYFIIYTGFFVIWVFICFKQRLTVDKIHLIMGALLLFKALKLVCAAEDKLFVRKTGTPHGWDIAFYIFGFFKGDAFVVCFFSACWYSVSLFKLATKHVSWTADTLLPSCVVLFTVIILIGTGWSFLKPYLQEREKNVLIIVIPLQVLENIASAVIGETGPATKDWLTWNQIFLLIDVVCCCAVFFPIIWSIRSLREASKTDGKAARNLAKLTLFKQFYVVVVCYIYFTRVVVFWLGAVVIYKYQWVVTMVVEGASLAFYVYIFYNFQPIERNPYLAIDDEEEAAAAQALEEDDSFEL